MNHINWLSILLAALIPILVGFVFYHEKVFGKAWMESLGLKKEDARKANMAVLFGASFVMSFILANFILYNVDGPGQEGQFDSFKHGAFHGVLLSLMVAAPVMVINGLFEMRKWKTMLINIGFWFVCIVLMAGLLDAMNHSPYGASM